MPSSVSQASNGPGTPPVVLSERDPLGQIGVGHDHGAADDVGMAAQVLGRRVDHGVGAEGERLLQVRRGERVVHHEHRARLVAAWARARMSATFSSGLVGVAVQIIRTGRAASCSRTAARSDMGTTS